MIRDYQAIMKSWFLKGQQRIIKTYGKHEGVKLVGCLDYETGKVYVEEHKKYDAKTFLSFLKNEVKVIRMIFKSNQNDQFSIYQISLRIRSSICHNSLVSPRNPVTCAQPVIPGLLK